MMSYRARSMDLACVLLVFLASVSALGSSDPAGRAIQVYAAGRTLRGGWIFELLSTYSHHTFAFTWRPDAADLIVSELGDPPFNFTAYKSAVRLLWSGENTVWKSEIVNPDDWDIIAGFTLPKDVPPSMQSKYVRLPYPFMWFLDPRTLWFPPKYEARINDWRNPEATAREWMDRPFNVTFIASRLPYPREEMVQTATRALGTVHCPGQALHNWDLPAGFVKIDNLHKYRFNICPENTGPPAGTSGYHSEKVYDAFLAGAVPFYWAGTIREPEHYMINPNRIIFFNPEDPGASSQRMLELMNNESARIAFFSQPFFKPTVRRYITRTCMKFAQKVLDALEARHVDLPASHPSPHLCDRTLEHSQSQDDQDIIVLKDYFKGFCGGVFLEVGGADGKSNSNTYAFEVDMGWTGVLIEASTSAFKQLTSRPERNLSIHINGAIGDREGQVTYIEIDGPQSQLSCVREFASPQHLERIDRDIEHALKNGQANTRKEIQVPMRPLHAWLDLHNISHINFFSLDVEGAELRVLETMDFKRIQVDVLTVEHNGQLENITAHLLSRGFHKYKETTHDAMYCNFRSACQHKAMIGGILPQA